MSTTSGATESADMGPGTGPRSMVGGCLCGAVRYRVEGEVLGFQYCHCSRCRKLTGSAHAANLFTPPGALAWMHGAELRGTYMLHGEQDSDPSSGRAAAPDFPTAFCTTCGSTLPSMSSTGKYWVVPAGSVEGDPGIRPTRGIFWMSRAPWTVDPGDLPRHDELPAE